MGSYSSMSTTNKFDSTVDESHMEMTQKVMDKMLQGGKRQDNLDTGWTLAPKNSRKENRKKEAAETDSSVTTSPTSTSEQLCAMEPMGFEPTTSCMPCKRSPNWAMAPDWYNNNIDSRHQQVNFLFWFLGLPNYNILRTADVKKRIIDRWKYKI